MIEQSEDAADKVGVAAKRTNLLAELKRRNVIRMAGLYLVGAWLVIQVAATLLPTFDAPGWVMKVLVALLAVGFLAAVVFSWLYELTPDGLKRDGEVAPDQSVAAATGKRMDRLLLIGMLAVIGVIAADRFWPRELSQPSSPAAPLPSTLPAPVVPIVDPPANAAADPADKPIVRGIAVLPFDNLSPDPDNAFFAGGVYEEVMTKLSRIGELRVISRTSMERIAEDKLEVGAIGARLGVSHVLEGSVRKSGDQIRVTVQLIEAANDNHVWAENYDRKLDDVFAIQSEIAIAIADQLKLSLSPELQANLSERPTQNQAAYALYLRALEERRGGWRGAEGFKDIIALLEPAVAADPDFLQARVRLAEGYGRMKWINNDPDGSYAAKAQQAVAAIVQRWPDHPQSKIALGQLLYNLERDYAGALTHFEAAREQLPGDIDLLLSISFSLKQLGRNEAYLKATRRTLELDPESITTLSELALALLRNQRFDEAVTTAESVLERSPMDQSRFVLALAKLARDGDIDAVLELAPDSSEGRIARFVQGDIEALLQPRSANVGKSPGTMRFALLQQIELLRLAGRDDAAQVLLDGLAEDVSTSRALIEDPSTPAIRRSWRHAELAYWAALSGEPTQAREHLTQAQAFPPSGDVAWFFVILSYAERTLGNAEAAWLLIQPYIGSGQLGGSLSHGELRAFKPFYDKVYGESPSYRAYVAKLGEAASKTPPK